MEQRRAGSGLGTRLYLLVIPINFSCGVYHVKDEYLHVLNSIFWTQSAFEAMYLTTPLNSMLFCTVVTLVHTDLLFYLRSAVNKLVLPEVVGRILDELNEGN